MDYAISEKFSVLIYSKWNTAWAEKEHENRSDRFLGLDF